MLWSSIPKRKVHTKINQQVKKSLYNWILQHLQVLQSPISKDCLKVSIDGHYEPQLVSKLLLQVSVWGRHNRMVSPPEEGGLKEARYVDNNITISYYTLQSILSPQLKNMYAQYKIMCGCECYIFAKGIHSSLLSWCDRYLRKLNNISQSVQNRRSGENSNHLFDIYINSVMPHGLHIYATAADMAMATMCAFPPSQHALSHWKCSLLCCYNFPHIDLPGQESDKHHFNTSPSIFFHIYPLNLRCIVHGDAHYM